MPDSIVQIELLFIELREDYQREAKRDRGLGKQDQYSEKGVPYNVENSKKLLLDRTAHQSSAFGKQSSHRPSLIKQNIMLPQRPQGYTSSLPSHGDPAAPPPPLKLTEQKQEETLLGANIKAFIRERLFGNFVNYTRGPPLRKTRPTARLLKQSILDATLNEANRSSPMIRQMFKQRVSSQRVPLQRKRQQQRQKSHRHSLGQQLRQRTKINQTTLVKSKRDTGYAEHLSSLQVERMPASSFISAIQEVEQQTARRRKQTLLAPLKPRGELGTKLPAIKSVLANSSQHLPTSKFQIFRYDINQTIWENYCVLQKNKFQVKSEKSIESSSFLNKSVFSRDAFLRYLNNTQEVYPSLAQFFYGFFEISNKIYDEMKIEEYKKVMENLVIANSRAWAFAIFRWWDRNQDGYICSKDIFAIYQLLDQMLYDPNNTPKSKCMKAIKVLKDVLQQLRAGISKNSSDKQEMRYLQEAYLRKKQVKYSQLSAIFGQQTGKAKKAANSVIDINKQVSVKFSSCYRYSYIATDHNQQTRENRDHIEGLKQQLRIQKQLLSSGEQKVIDDTVPIGISYTQFLEGNYFTRIKEIILEVFAIIIY